MNRYTPQELIQKYNQNTCSEEERALVESWHLADLSESTHIPSKKTISIVHQRMWVGISSRIGYTRPNSRFSYLWPKIAITASLVAVISIASYLYLNKQTSPVLRTSFNLAQNDIAPGKDKAVLILSNGKRVYLNERIHGLLAIQGNVSISKSPDGKFIYYNKTKGPAVTNKLETPRGGKYQVALPDGTMVWLNAASVLSYPTTFEGNDRQVKLQGEAYFEVAKNHNKPFKVITDDQTVEVLGTHFNINAYPEERQTQTTLLEGSIRLFKGAANKLLKPGQAAVVDIDSKNIMILPADLEKNLAWKNNEFIFNGEDLYSIMKAVSRWYDIEVIYEGKPNKTTYWGVVSRSKNLSDVLKMLQSTGRINYKIQGRRITIMN